jgi:hypothetical protein
MNIRTLLFAGAAMLAVGAPLSANAAEGRAYDRDSYSRDWRDGRQHGDTRSVNAALRRIDYLQRQVYEGRREGWLNRNMAQRLNNDLRETRQDVTRASYRFGNRMPIWMAQRVDQRLDDIDRTIDRLEAVDRWNDRRGDRHDDRDGRWDGRGDGRNSDYDRDGLRR